MTVLLVVSDGKLKWKVAAQIARAVCAATGLECFMGTNGNLIFEEPEIQMVKT